jgi:SNF2 family DNA or RNA helicase
MLFNWSQNRNSILADEMGLGKTIQAAAFLQLLAEAQVCLIMNSCELGHPQRAQDVKGPFLIVVPLSTVGNWMKELQGWTTLDAVCYAGTAENRKVSPTCFA